MLILALVVVGAASYVRLGVDRFPSVDLPTVSVRTQLPGASTEEVETEISKRIEEAVNSVEGIDELRSISGPGASVVIVTFNLNRDIDTAAQDVRDRVAAVLPDLPKDATVPLISKVDNDQQPVLTVALAGDRPLRELTELADKVVKIRLERSAGVGEVRIVGGLERAVSVWVDADRLAAYQIPITAVRDAIARQNTDASGGNVTRGAREETLWAIGRQGAAGRCRPHGDPGPVPLHIRRFARDQRAPDPRKHSGLPRRFRVHAQLAVDRDRRSGHPRVGGLDLRHDVGAPLHAQHRDDARPRP